MLTTNKDLARMELSRLGIRVKIDLILEDADGGYDGFSLAPAYKGSRKIRQEAGRKGWPGYHRWVDIVPEQKTIYVLMLADCAGYQWPKEVLLEEIDGREKVVAIPGEPEVIEGVWALVCFDVATDWA